MKEGFGHMRIQVTLSEKMVSRIDRIAEDMGVTRSSCCNFLIGQSVTNYERANDALSSIPQETILKALSSVNSNK